MEKLMNERGFTVIEVAICLALLVIVVLGMVYVITENSYLEEANKEKILALNCARRMLENVKAQTYEDIVPGNYTFDVSEHGIALGRIDPYVPVGMISIGNEDAEGCKPILVTVEWRTARDMPLRVQLQTLVTDH
jgi:prepilin-type N-terminal cleavage/methylation domain-containing protein